MSSPGELPFDAAEYDALPSTAMVPGSHSPANLRGLARIVQQALRGRYWFLIPISVILAVTGAVAGWKSVTPRYTSEGNLQIMYQLPTVLPDHTSYVDAMSMYDEVLLTQCTILRSKNVIEQALKNPLWSANNKGPIDSTAIHKFVENLTVDHPGRTQTIRITYTDSDPGMAAAAVKAVVAAYSGYYHALEEHQGDVQMTALRNRETELEAEMRQERASLDSISKSVDGAKIEILHARKQQDVANIEDSMHRVELAMALSKGRAGSGDFDTLTVSQIGMIDGVMRDKLVGRKGLELQHLDWNSKYGPNNPKVKELDSTIRVRTEEIEQYATEFRDLQKRISQGNAANMTTEAGPLGALVGNSPEALERQHATLDSLRKTAQAEMASITIKLLEFRRLEQKINDLQMQLDRGERQMGLFKLEHKMGGRLSVINDGDIPITPSNDRRKMASTGLGLCGLMLPVGLAICGTSVRRKFRFSDDAEASENLPALLGILPALPEPVTDPEQASIASHCVHQIRIMLQILGRKSGQKTSRVHVITSASTGDGKTSITMALGLSFASSGSRTLLLDCDIIGRGLTSRLRASQSPGLLESLHAASLQGNIKKTSTKNLYVLPVGGVGDSPNVGSLAPDTLRRLLAEARRIFDVIVIDTGPVLGSLEAQMASSIVDDVVLCVSRGQSQSLVLKSLRQLRNVGANIAGLVFNKAEKNDFQRSVSSNSRKSTRSTRSTPADPSTTPRTMPVERKDRSSFGPLAGAVAYFLPGSEQAVVAPRTAAEQPRSTSAVPQAPPIDEGALFDTVMGRDALEDSDDETTDQNSGQT